MARARVSFVIMAGGRGERLWPLVRENTPKVCLRPDGEQSLLDMTLSRLKPWATPHNTLIVTTKEQAPWIRKSLPKRFHQAIFAEPQPKNTAACVALAASILAARHQDAIMSVLPADHWIPDAKAFGQSLQAAIETAQQHPVMVMIGVKPTRVHPGLGHLCVRHSLGRRHGCQVFRLTRFIEKPTPSAARSLMRRNRVFWNAGIFVGQTAVFRELIQRWLPQHARHVFPLGGQAGKADFSKIAASAYRALQAVSFDDGVMAHLRTGFVVEGRFVWEDLGSWESWMRIHRLKSPSVAVDSPNVHVLANNGHPCSKCGAGKHLIATIGLRDVIVIHTPEATLICHAHRTQAVRTVVAQLASDPELSQHA